MFEKKPILVHLKKFIFNDVLVLRGKFAQILVNMSEFFFILGFQKAVSNAPRVFSEQRRAVSGIILYILFSNLIFFQAFSCQ
jgi:hypothetical protein